MELMISGAAAWFGAFSIKSWILNVPPSLSASGTAAVFANTAAIKDARYSSISFVHSVSSIFIFFPLVVFFFSFSSVSSRYLLFALPGWWSFLFLFSPKWWWWVPSPSFFLPRRRNRTPHALHRHSPRAPFLHCTVSFVPHAVHALFSRRRRCSSAFVFVFVILVSLSSHQNHKCQFDIDAAFQWMRHTFRYIEEEEMYYSAPHTHTRTHTLLYEVVVLVSTHASSSACSLSLGRQSRLFKVLSTKVLLRGTFKDISFFN